MHNAFLDTRSLHIILNTPINKFIVFQTEEIANTEFDLILKYNN